eukprot:SAG22_NODE_391_length_11223_cov_7.451187_5_plen_175_part_00
MHPALCVTQSGAVLCAYNTDGGGAQVLLLCRSDDQGRTFSAPAPIPSSAGRCEAGVYPGSLSVLRNGHIVLQWARYHNSGGKASGDNQQHNLCRLAAGMAETDAYRVPEFCVSVDDGRAFGPPVEIPHDALTNYTALRFPLIELDEDRWVLPFYDRTVTYRPAAGRVEQFGDGR